MVILAVGNLAVLGAHAAIAHEQNDLSARLLALEEERDRAVVDIQALKVDPSGEFLELFTLNRGAVATQLGEVWIEVEGDVLPLCTRSWPDAPSSSLVVRAYNERYDGEYPTLAPGEASDALLPVAPCRADELAAIAAGFVVTLHPTKGEAVRAHFAAPLARSDA